MSRFPMTVMLMALLVYTAVALVGCHEEPKTALWYMANGPALQAKLLDCKKHSASTETDANCLAANEAFMTIMTVDAQQKAAAANGNAAPAR